MTARRVLAAVDVERSGRESQVFDAVEVLTFPDAAAARRWVGSLDAERAALPLAGLTGGTSRVLAEPSAVI